jgi:hypothetical protein
LIIAYFILAINIATFRYIVKIMTRLYNHISKWFFFLLTIKRKLKYKVYIVLFGAI